MKPRTTRLQWLYQIRCKCSARLSSITRKNLKNEQRTTKTHLATLYGHNFFFIVIYYDQGFDVEARS